MRGTKAKRLRREAVTMDRSFPWTDYQLYSTPEYKWLATKDDEVKKLFKTKKGIPSVLSNACSKNIYKILKNGRLSGFILGSIRKES